MAILKENMIVQGGKGNVGRQFVLRTRAGVTILGKMPTFNASRAATEEQLTVRENFADASMYAQGAITSEELKALYQKKAKGMQNAYNIAFRDFLKSPTIKQVDLDAYTGEAASTIVVSAKDDFRVVEVAVSIFDPNGVLVEKGFATLNPLHRIKWIYTVTTTHNNPQDYKIVVTVKDVPGNKTTAEIVVD